MGPRGEALTEDEVVERTVKHVVNADFDDVRQTPPWRVFVLPLEALERTISTEIRYLVAFNYSHSHGDGLSGLAFHRSFAEALSSADHSGSSEAESGTVQASTKDLPHAPGPFPISWSFLLKVLVKEFLPWLTSIWDPYPKATVWTGSPMSCDDRMHTTSKLVTIDHQTLTTALNSWRPHGVKLTALLHLAIVRSLTTQLGAAAIRRDSFVSGTPIDLRKLFGLSSSDMGVNASSVSFQHLAYEAGSPVSVKELMAAQQQTRDLAFASSTKQDQVIGLLEYAKPLRKWHLGKMGKTRDSSYEVSNLMTFDPPSIAPARMDRIVFAQPADASGHPLSFNVVSMKKRALEIAISWQVGALALPGSVEKRQEVEEEFVAGVATALKKEFEFLSTGPIASQQ